MVLEQQLLEAVTLRDKHERISKAFSTWLYSQPYEKRTAGITYWSLSWDMYIFDSYLIAKGDGRYYKYNFSTSADGYNFDGPVEVDLEFSTKLGESAPDVSFEYKDENNTFEVETLLEAASGDKKGKEWEVVIIKAGMSKNGRNYSKEVLKESVSKFDGVPVFADHQTDAEAAQKPERSVDRKVGKIVNPRFVESSGEIRGTLKVINPKYQALLKEAYDQDEMDFVGLSIDARGKTEYKSIGSKRYLDVTEVHSVKSVDVVTLPAAGGKLTRLVAGMMDEDEDTLNEDIESTDISESSTSNTGNQGDEETMTREQLLALLKEAVQSDPDEIKTILSALSPVEQQAVKDQAIQEAEKPTAPEGYDQVLETIREIKASNKAMMVKNRVDALIAGYSTLSPFAKTKLTEAYIDAGSRRDFTDEEFKTDADAWVAEEAKHTAGHPNSVVREGEGNSVGKSENEKFNLALRGLISGRTEDGVEPFRNIREAYVRMVPGADIMDNPLMIMRALTTPYDSEADGKRIKESVTSSTFGEIFADNMHFTMQREYQESDLFSWTKLASEIVGVSDFRTNHVGRIGDYGTIDPVAEGQTYQAIATPGDEEITFTVSKFGNTEDLTMEALLADRVNSLTRIPRKLGRAAARTAYNFFMQLITTTNPTMPYDSTALYSHSNSGTSAFSLAALNATNVAMKRTLPFGTSSDYLGKQNQIKYIIAQSNMEALVSRVISPSSSFIYALNQQAGHADSNTATQPDTANILDPEMFKGQGIEFFEYEQLGDSNNWFAVADPRKMPTFIAAFLNNRREPDLFTQNDPNSGSMFNADKITYKVRFIFGGAMQEHRSVYRQVVT